MSSITERLQQYMHEKGLNPNRITVEAGLSVGLIGKSIKNNAGLNSDTIEKILHSYVDINPEWFLLGKGAMIREENSVEKMAPKMAPNVAPNFESDRLNISNEPQPYIYSGEQPDIEEDTDRRMEVILYQNELLEERERTIYALNEVINAQKDALKAQKALINEYENRLGELEPIHKPNGKTAG